jgi:hypothetical protein
MGCSGAIMVLCSLLFYHKWSSDISNEAVTNPDYMYLL